MPLSLANKITFLRLFCVPFFVLLLLYYDRTVHYDATNHGLRLSASILFIVTFCSDAIDGYLARRKKQITRLGTILDPLVDKTLLLSALILLTYASKQSYEMHLPIWFVWLVICRDVMLVAGDANPLSRIHRIIWLFKNKPINRYFATFTLKPDKYWNCPYLIYN